MTKTQPSPLPDRLELSAWPDPVLEQIGEPVTSPYVERFWLPTLGPSLTLLLRRVAIETRQTDPWCVTTGELGGSLGLAGGAQSALARCFARAQRFQLALGAGACWRFRTHLGPLPECYSRRLPERLRRQHQQLVAKVSA